MAKRAPEVKNCHNNTIQYVVSSLCRRCFDELYHYGHTNGRPMTSVLDQLGDCVQLINLQLNRLGLGLSNDMSLLAFVSFRYSLWRTQGPARSRLGPSILFDVGRIRPQEPPSCEFSLNIKNNSDTSGVMNGVGVSLRLKKSEMSRMVFGSIGERF